MPESAWIALTWLLYAVAAYVGLVAALAGLLIGVIVLFIILGGR